MLTVEHVQQADMAICNADLVYGQLETSQDTIAAAFRCARHYDVRTVLNASTWQHLPEPLLDATEFQKRQ